MKSALPFKPWRAISVAGLAIITGYVVVRIFAAGPAGVFTVPNGTVANGATIVNNGVAIGGRMVVFGPTVAPTPTPTPVPTLTPTPTPTGNSTCPLPAYPHPSCTGVPAGTSFSHTVNGDYTITTNGTVIDGWHITGDLEVNAANVTIRNSEIDGSIDNQGTQPHYGPFTVTDTTIGPASGCIGFPALGESEYTATRVYIRNHDDGYRVAEPGSVTITDSYARLCFLPPSAAPPDGSHSDGLQNYCSQVCGGLTFIHNTIDSTGITGNSGIYLGSPQDGQFNTATINDNLFDATGSYIMSLTWQSGSTWVVHNNRLVNHWTNGPVDAESTCSHQDWSGNSIVTIDASYNITSTVSAQGCVN